MEFTNTHEAPEVTSSDMADNDGLNQELAVAHTGTSPRTLCLRPRFRRVSTSKPTGDDLASLSIVTPSDSIHSKIISEVYQLDRMLEDKLKDEKLPTSDDATAITIRTSSPYHNWECGFGFAGHVDEPEEIPNTKAEFIEAVKGEITTIGFIQNGLTSYSEAINSGVHHAFSTDFLKHQTDATHKTIGQLFQISRHLQNVIKDVEVVQESSNEVSTELKEAYAHAQPWIQRTRAILVSSHVFYKINYVLGSDKNKQH